MIDYPFYSSIGCFVFFLVQNYFFLYRLSLHFHLYHYNLPSRLNLLMKITLKMIVGVRKRKIYQKSLKKLLSFLVAYLANPLTSGSSALIFLYSDFKLRYFSFKVTAFYLKIYLVYWSFYLAGYNLEAISITFSWHFYKISSPLFGSGLNRPSEHSSES